MRYLLKNVGCLSIFLTSAFAKNPNTLNENHQSTLKLYGGLGVEGNLGYHRYNLMDMGTTPHTPTAVTFPPTHQTSGGGQIQGGFRIFTPRNHFFGMGIDFSIGNHETSFEKGTYVYDDIKDLLHVSDSLYTLNCVPMNFKVKTSSKFNIHLHVGYQYNDIRIYGKLGAIHRVFKYSYYPSDTTYLKTSFSDKKHYSWGALPALGAERKISDQCWMGIELGWDIYPNFQIQKDAIYALEGARRNFIPIEGRSRFLNLALNFKIEL